MLFYFLKVNLHQFSNINSHKEVKRYESVFLTISFIQGSGSVSQMVPDPGGPKTYGSYGSEFAHLTCFKWHERSRSLSVFRSVSIRYRSVSIRHRSGSIRYRSGSSIMGLIPIRIKNFDDHKSNRFTAGKKKNFGSKSTEAFSTSKHGIA